MDFAWLRLLVFLLVVGTDFGIAVYGRYVKGEKNNVGYAAHIAGGLAGLLVGIGVLRNLEKHRWEKILWWIAIAVYVVLMVAAVIWNAAFDEHFPESDLNKQVKSDSSPAQKPFFD
ncbi:unnamed protein product [Cyprideis torosa]|uniref:Uncharacterized protein n=1 Tax=Cyprideis torosa TaxID=163714 RepID=A0A7R8WKD1_9CRUS|nr:unnamed protein product [Cyprideis torosa]CAG0900320.1 unnamed protein product [Cyprideis torosa]